MERLDSRIHEKYAALKKRKLPDEGLERKREERFEELCKEFKDWVRGLGKDNAELTKKLVAKQDELEKAREEFLEDIRTRDNEIQRLNRLLDEAEKSNSKTQTPPSHGKVKRVMLIENAPHSSPAEESQELECSTRPKCISGNRTNEIPRVHMLCSLLQSLVRMKISVNDKTEIFSISACHEASGYSFTLTWLEKSEEWSYKVSSLGTLERIAAEWMGQDIRFSTKMFHRFFERIANIITQG